MSKYGHRSHDWFEAVINKLGGEEAAEMFLRGETVVMMANRPDFKVWKTIKLGTGLKTADDFRRSAIFAGCVMDVWCKTILREPEFRASDTETEVDLVVVSVEELGFTDGATRADIYKQAKLFGLEICPAEVGPQLRMQYKYQPRGERLLIGMEPIKDLDGHPLVFLVEHEPQQGDLWLGAHHGDLDHFWHGRSRWVFLRHK